MVELPEPADFSNADEMTKAELQHAVGSLVTAADKFSNTADRMLADSALSRKAMVENTAALTRSKKQNRWLKILIAGLVAALAAGGFVVWRDHVQSDCIKKWGIATNDRSSKLSTPSVGRVSNLYGALGAATGGTIRGVQPPPARTQLIAYVDAQRKFYPLLVAPLAELKKQTDAQLVSTYYLILGLHSNNDFVDAAGNNPVPDSPSFCSAF